MAKYQILRQEIDESKKIRCWVDIGNGEVQIFKFQEEPSKTIIQQEVDKLLSNRPTKEQELEEINRQIALLEERKSQIINKETIE